MGKVFLAVPFSVTTEGERRGRQPATGRAPPRDRSVGVAGSRDRVTGSMEVPRAALTTGRSVGQCDRGWERDRHRRSRDFPCPGFVIAGMGCPSLTPTTLADPAIDAGARSFHPVSAPSRPRMATPRRRSRSLRTPPRSACPRRGMTVAGRPPAYRHAGVCPGSASTRPTRTAGRMPAARLGDGGGRSRGRGHHGRRERGREGPSGRRPGVDGVRAGGQGGSHPCQCRAEPTDRGSPIIRPRRPVADEDGRRQRDVRGGWRARRVRGRRRPTARRR